MPALATIDPPNARPPPIDSRQHVPDQKKKPKPSSLCYTPPAMINDKKRDRSYFRRGLLGEGGFARCFEVTDFQGTRLAAKCIAKKSITTEKVKMKLLGEIKVHKSMDHPNIVRQQDCFEDEVNVYMILDICTNGTLMDMLRNRKRFTEPEVRYFGLQILGAAKYMHSRRVIHRDLKLGNLFLDEHMCIKVGDFGLAALLVDDDDRKKTICGTPNYIAPEVLFGSAEGHSYEVDLWSIGVIFYAMLVGKPPFQSKDVKAIYAKIKSNEYEFPAAAEISPHARTLITSLLSTDPENRPSIDDIANHAFFNTGIMPRSIPASAVHTEPQWPGGQATSIFKRNLQYVSTEAGIGRDQTAGKEQGQMVDVAVERPERGRYLPVSLSPRTGPTAKMVNLKNERAGGRTDTLSDRLNSVKIEEEKSQTDQSASQPAHRPLGRDLRRTTVNNGALRSQGPIANTLDHQSRPQDEKLTGHLQAPTRVDAAGDRPEPTRTSSRLRGAARVVSEPTRPITRSARFVNTQGLNRALTDTKEVSEPTPNVLARPIRRTASANSAVGLYERETTSRPSSRLATLRNEANIGRPGLRSTNRGISPLRTELKTSSDADSAVSEHLVSQPVSRVSSTEPWTPQPEVPQSTVRTGSAARQLSPIASDSIWPSVRKLAGQMEVSLNLRHRRPGYHAPNVAIEVIHIAKWVDYSHRYGLGYQLSNEATGVYYNDSTSIVLPNRAVEFDYIIASSARTRHALEAPPKELEKKVYLLKHFKGYMTTHLNNAASETQSPSNPDTDAFQCYMTHYWRTKAGILFRLSDGTLQLNFTDHSKLMIPVPVNDDQCIVRYVDTEKNTNIWRLEDALCSEECREKIECASKILYTFAKLEGRGTDES